jgi:hypothetical protein
LSCSEEPYMIVILETLYYSRVKYINVSCLADVTWWSLPVLLCSVLNEAVVAEMYIDRIDTYSGSKWSKMLCSHVMWKYLICKIFTKVLWCFSLVSWFLGKEVRYWLKYFSTGKKTGLTLALDQSLTATDAWSKITLSFWAPAWSF